MVLKEPWFERFFVEPEMVPRRTHLFQVLRETFIGSLNNYLRKWFFKDSWFERFFVEPEMVPRRTMFGRFFETPLEDL